MLSVNICITSNNIIAITMMVKKIPINRIVLTSLLFNIRNLILLLKNNHFYKALQQLNHKDEKVYMIGDTCLDIISAKEAGVTPIAVYSGYASKEKLHNCSEIVVKDALKAVEMIFSTSF